MSRSIPVTVSANPGFPGFSRFWVRRFARSLELARKTLERALRRMRSENFPAGKRGIWRAAESSSEFPAWIQGTIESHRTFLQESFHLRSSRANHRLPAAAITRGIAMPPTK
jgi:hypothetical protein